MGAVAEYRRKMGRTSLLTPQLQKEFIDGLLVCCTIKTACQSVGISTATYRYWKRTASAALDKETELTEYEEDCISFLTACTEARGKSKRTLLLSVMKHVVKDHCEHCGRRGDPKLGLKLLAQCHPEEYSERRVTRTTRHEGPGGGPVQVMLVDPREFLLSKMGTTIEMQAAEELSHAEIQKRIGQQPTNGNGNGLER